MSSHKKIILLVILSLAVFKLHAKDGRNAWTPISNERVQYLGERLINPISYLSYHLQQGLIYDAFKMAPVETPESNRISHVIVSIPMPDGTFQDFRVMRSEVMHPDLAARYPDIETYSGQGITDPSASAKFDFTQFGFHAMILSATGSVYIDPYSQQDQQHYMVYYKKDFVTTKDFVCLSEGGPSMIEQEHAGLGNSAINKSVGPELKTYRLAMAATGEYTSFHGGTVGGALAAIVTSVNRVTGVYEREFAIRLVLIANTDTLIFTNAATDPYTNNDGGIMLGQNQTTCMARIGGANFDIGHVFSTGGGGIAGLGVVCFFSQKAHGVTGSSSPIGDPFDIDYVAHEIGHQFGGNHTFNCEVGACQGNRSFTTAYEPGSGSTIMAYAGICGNNNLQSNSDDYFHTKSFDEIIVYTTTGIGANCPVVTTTSNNAPVINPGANYIIPYLTPFRLTGDATDPDGDPVTYCWEQFNLGPGGSWNAPVSNAPIFRSFDPTSNPVRLFPKLSNILSNTQTIGEVKPSYARILQFKLTARDNRLNGGGVTNMDTPMQVEVINTGQAFAVTSPNVTGIVWSAGGIETVTWDIGGSDVAPINTPLVNILLSTDGGQTFPTVLASQVPNNGSFNVNVPNTPTTTARVMVEGDGNIFFDINDKNFEIGFVGIAENSNSAGVYIKPNPAKESFEFILKDVSLLANESNVFEISDMTGRLIKSEKIVSTRQIIQLNAIPSGLYLFRFMNSDGVLKTGKLLVQ
ncbi:MAG: T9SS type A sorting domain-containing protein [Bacteroidetes bacterium]|nr:T9SS type A sorting domain-containing protein [Bacteroidota bacterium]